jgi:hypothetical protein
MEYCLSNQRVIFLYHCRFIERLKLMLWFVIYIIVCALFDGFVRSGYGVSRFEFLKACGCVIPSSLVETYMFGGMLRL